MSWLKHEGSPAREPGEELSTGTAEPPAQPEAGACNKALVTTAFLVPLDNNTYPSHSTRKWTLLKKPPAKQPKYLAFHRELMRLNMLGTKNTVFKSADWLPEEMNGDRSEIETCFSLFSSPTPLPHKGKKKYIFGST